MTDDKRTKAAARVSDADATRVSSLDDRHQLVSGVGAQHVSSLEAGVSLSLELQNPDGRSRSLHFVMTPAAAYQLAKALQKAVRHYLHGGKH